MLAYNMLQHWFFGHALVKRTIKGLSKRIHNNLQVPPKPLIKNIRQKAKSLVKEDKPLVIDAASHGHLEWVALILASYQTIYDQFKDKQKTITFISQALLSSFDTWLFRLLIKIYLKKISKDPRLAQKTFSNLMKLYGVGFTWQVNQNKQVNSCTLTISRCFYFEYFKKHGIPELTPVLCKIDSLWFEKIDPEKLMIEFDKSNYKTQGYGATHCEFPLKFYDKPSIEKN